MGKPTRSAQVGKLAMLGGTVVLVMLLGSFLVRVGRGVPSDDQPRAIAGESDTRSPVAAESANRCESSAQSGFAHTEEGAARAGVAYATAAQRWLYFTDEQIHRTVTRLATPAAAERLASDVITQVAVSREQLKASDGPVWWLVRPLASKVVTHTLDQAEVSVWVVTVLSAARVAAPQSEWLTVTIDLTWLDGNWHVSAVRDAPGPTPMTGPNDRPWDAEPFGTSLDGFTRIDEEVTP